MSSIRARFVRGEEVKYISHLDLMKVFERSLRRANVPIAYSQGFNPHPQMVFGLPLSVGVTSEAEYADFDLAVDMTPELFMEMLNGSLPSGLRVTGAEYLNTRSNIMKEISAAVYDVLVSLPGEEGINYISEKLRELLNQTEISVMKEGKKGARPIDIKPMIYAVEIKNLFTDESERVDTGNTSIMPERSGVWVKEYADAIKEKSIQGLSYKVESLCSVSMLLSAGSAANLKPELVLQALNEKYVLDLKAVKIHRIGLYVNKGGRILDPLDTIALS